MKTYPITIANITFIHPTIMLSYGRVKVIINLQINQIIVRAVWWTIKYVIWISLFQLLIVHYKISIAHFLPSLYRI